jgi:type III secretion protein I
MIDATGIVPALASVVQTTGNAVAPISSDVERFRLALSDGGAVLASPEASALQQTPASGVTAPSAASDSVAASAPTRPSQPSTLGEAILQGLQTASNDINQAWRSTGEVLSKPDITVADVLRVQGMLLQSAVQYELVGKAVSKSTQSLENILKTQ